MKTILFVTALALISSSAFAAPVPVVAKTYDGKTVYCTTEQELNIAAYTLSDARVLARKGNFLTVSVQFRSLLCQKNAEGVYGWAPYAAGSPQTRESDGHTINYIYSDSEIVTSDIGYQIINVMPVQGVKEAAVIFDLPIPAGATRVEADLFLRCNMKYSVDGGPYEVGGIVAGGAYGLRIDL